MNDDIFSWDDEVESDGSEFKIIMPGTYPAEITKVEKSRWTGNGKMNGYPYAKVTVKVTLEDGSTATTTDNLFLSRSCEFRIGNFLIACGLKKKKEPIKANKIPQAEHKKVMVTIGCKCKTDSGNYVKLNDADKITSYISKGIDVYNEISAYKEIEYEDDDDDEFGF